MTFNKLLSDESAWEKTIQPYIDKRLIRTQRHPEFPLTIYNYTQECQFSGEWDEVTMNCRGLILDDDHNVVARPFPKFFNYGEKPDVPSGRVVVFDKLDGSLGIHYQWNDEHFLATRGSFLSEQAIKGTQMLRELNILDDILYPNTTYLFEIIYPQNRIVVDYGKQETLVLLGHVDNETGKSVHHKEKVYFDVPNVIQEGQFPGMSIEALRSQNLSNKEGFVLWWPEHDHRIKIKFDEYVRLHRLVTGLTKRRVWDILRNDGEKALEELMKNIPEEFEQWIKYTKNELLTQFFHIADNAMQLHDKCVKRSWDRKKIAMWLNSDPARKQLAPLVFNLLDGHKPADKIWKMIKPAHEEPFKTEV